MDRLVRAGYADGSSTQHVYDEDGDLTSKTDNDPGGYLIYAVSYSYDALDRSISEQPTGKAANTVTWDANSRMLTFTDPSGILTYGYDDAGSLTCYRPVLLNAKCQRGCIVWPTHTTEDSREEIRRSGATSVTISTLSNYRSNKLSGRLAARRCSNTQQRLGRRLYRDCCNSIDLDRDPSAGSLEWRDD